MEREQCTRGPGLSFGIIGLLFVRCKKRRSVVCADLSHADELHNLGETWGLPPPQHTHTHMHSHTHISIPAEARVSVFAQTLWTKALKIHWGRSVEELSRKP